MGIYHKDMEMPERCWDCDLCYDSYYCRPLGVQFADREDHEPGERRLSDCPLVHVPPHGRLIDADEAYKAIKKWIVKFYSAYEQDKKDERIAALLELDLAVRMALHDAPTIIPAEEVEK